MIRFVKWSLVAALFCSSNTFGQHSRIFPQPQMCIPSTDVFTFAGQLWIEESEDLQPVFDYLQKQFIAESGTILQYATNNKKPNITISRSNSVQEGFYSLMITKGGIRIEYSDEKGLFYGFQSLFQQTVSSGQIECVLVEDWPVFGYRGVHLDCARHFFTLPELKKFIDQMARLKFNKFHWHLTDDQGWRLEIKKYPKLTEIGAWRDQTLVGHFSDNPVVYDGKRYGGFYTQEEAKELIKYAVERGIEIIPEIEMPGHARAALAAYPELGCTGIQQGVAETWGVFDDVFCSKEQTLTFLEGVLDEVCAIFPSQTIHIGGDESPKTRWKVCPACQQQIKDHDLYDEHELQSFVIQRMSKYLKSKGKTLMGWDEILEGGLAQSAQVMSWRGTEGGIAAAKFGHPVVMTPTSYCYFDYYQSGSPGEPLAIGGYLPLEKVYAFQPIPKELSETERKYIIGGQANLWTEYLPTFDAVCYSAFPRLLAMSEVLWTEEINRGPYPDFVQGLVKYQFPYYDKAQIDYSTASLEPTLSFTSTENGLLIHATSNVKNTSAIIAFNNGEASVAGTEILDEKNLADPKRNVIAEYTDSSKSSIICYQSTGGIGFGYSVKVKQGDEVLRENNYSAICHIAIGKKISFQTPPSEKYNVNGSLGLTDGVEGDFPWKGNQWLGFEEDTVQFVLDLGQKTKFGVVKLGYLNDPGSWIYAPIECVFEYSDDGKNWTKTNAPENKMSSFFWLEQKLHTRYLRVTTVNNAKIPEGLAGAGFTPWTFLNELTIEK